MSPNLHVTVKHGTPNQKHDAMNVWIANVSTSQFEVCLQESRTFDGSHSNIMVVSNYSSSCFFKTVFDTIFSHKPLSQPMNTSKPRILKLVDASKGACDLNS